jgi:hypothetical protein
MEDLEKIRLRAAIEIVDAANALGAPLLRLIAEEDKKQLIEL